VDGTPDNSFSLNLGSGFDLTVQDIAVQTDGRILVAGWFGTVNGTKSSRIVRLNATGTIDGLFNVGAGLDWTGMGLAIQPNGQIIFVGHFGGHCGGD
jgi:tryptophan synthase beta subunit